MVTAIHQKIEPAQFSSGDESISHQRSRFACGRDAGDAGPNQIGTGFTVPAAAIPTRGQLSICWLHSNPSTHFLPGRRAPQARIVLALAARPGLTCRESRNSQGPRDASGLRQVPCAREFRIHRNGIGPRHRPIGLRQANPAADTAALDSRNNPVADSSAQAMRRNLRPRPSPRRPV